MLRCLFLLLMSTLLMAAFSMPAVVAQDNPLPAPTGPYQVGITSLTLLDESREEILTSEAGDTRAVTVWIWYPADVPEDAQPSPYLMEGFDVERSGFASQVAVDGGDPAATREWLQSLQRYAYSEAPVSTPQATYPVVMYSNLTPVDQSLQFEELASHGYIVVDVIHVTGYPVEDQGDFLQIGDTRVSFWDDYYGMILADLLFVLDQLEPIQRGSIKSPVSGRLNLEHIGVAGHSIMGAAVMDAASQDQRIKAGITQDFESSAAPPQPFMFMRSTTCQRFDTTGPAYAVHIIGFGHSNYADSAIWPRPLDAGQGRIGSIDGMRGMAVLNAYIVTFFDQYLKGEAKPLLQGPSAGFPEAEIQANAAATGATLPPQVITSQAGETIVLDDFESGTLANWISACNGFGSWYVYADGTTLPNPDATDPNAPFVVPDPPQGNFAAVTDMYGPGSIILYRDMHLDGSFRLHLTVFYINGIPDFFNPDTLAWEGAENQQFRVDLLDPSAPVDSLADSGLLATVFNTSPGDPASLDPTAITFDLSPWAGQTVRLRFANVNNMMAMRTGVDDIHLEPVE